MLWGGAVISSEAVPTRASNAAESSRYDFARLERAVSALAERKGQLEAENAELAKTVRDLELQIAEMQQRREDAITRVDELIERLDDLEAREAR